MPRTGLTEDTPATPSWVEERLDRILAALPAEIAQAMRPERGRYLDCLASTAGPADPLMARQRCHTALLGRLRAAGWAAEPLATLHERLEALEAELAENT